MEARASGVNPGALLGDGNHGRASEVNGCRVTLKRGGPGGGEEEPVGKGVGGVNLGYLTPDSKAVRKGLPTSKSRLMSGGGRSGARHMEGEREGPGIDWPTIGKRV